MSTDLLSLEHPSVLLFCFNHFISNLASWIDILISIIIINNFIISDIDLIISIAVINNLASYIDLVISIAVINNLASYIDLLIVIAVINNLITRFITWMEIFSLSDWLKPRLGKKNITR